MIGNAADEHVTPLNNPRADAEDMSKALCEIGFDVVEGYDLDRGAMDDKTIEFARRAETADLAFVVEVCTRSDGRLDLAIGDQADAVARA